MIDNNEVNKIIYIQNQTNTLKPIYTKPYIKNNNNNKININYTNTNSIP
jgi:viroplasmin and RNaseH domain-containing protein